MRGKFYTLLVGLLAMAPLHAVSAFLAPSRPGQLPPRSSPQVVHCGATSPFSSNVLRSGGAPLGAAFLTAMAAAARRRRRRGGATRDPGPAGPKVEMSQVAADAARGLSVTPEDQKRRREARRKRMMATGDEMDDGSDQAVANLINLGEDPSFFDFPFVWVQLAHLVIAFTAVFACLAGGNDVEFALFDLPPKVLEFLRTGTSIVFFMNFFTSVWIFFEEFSLGNDRLLSAIGWGLKALVLGGVATWQRYGRLSKGAAERRQAAKAAQAAAEAEAAA